MSNQPSFEATGLALWSVTHHIITDKIDLEGVDNLLKGLDSYHNHTSDKVIVRIDHTLWANFTVTSISRRRTLESIRG